MIGIPINSNSISIPIGFIGCCEAGFNSTYPVKLNGIISQDEFRESIDQINRRISIRATIIFVNTIFLLTIIPGMTCVLIAQERIENSGTDGVLPISIAGASLSIFALIFIIVGIIIIRSRRPARIREAISEESMKYSSRSPTSCSWRLETRCCKGADYYLVIDIGSSSAPGSAMYYSNQGVNESSFLTGQQNNYAPQPYFGQSTACCSQCGAARQDLSARFCSSCGQSFNKQ